MDRCKSYCGFAMWFAGIGYAVLWPFTANGDGGHLFGASIVCDKAHRGVLAGLCEMPHPFSLPVGLHVLGFLAAILVAASVLLRLSDRWRQRPGVVPAASVNVRLPGAIPIRSGPPGRRLRKVKPRKNFGLRGFPR